jgi:DNA-directed RNA polymerase subunit RPC12/RpoP
MTGIQDRCPECGSIDLRYGSTDPQEGTYFWCEHCGSGPILYPLGYRRKFIQPKIIDAEESNKALKLVQELKRK